MSARLFAHYPLPGETVYGIVARHARSVKGGSASGRELFGKARGASVGLPSFLRAFSRTLPKDWSLSPANIIAKHTILPLCLPFLSINARRRAITATLESSRVHLVVGAAPQGSLETTFLRYCPICARREARRYGFMSWNRVHQIFAVFYCSEHNVPLRETNLRPRHLFACVSFHPAELTCQSRPLHKLERGNTLLFEIAKDCQWLLEENVINPGPQRIHAALYRQLKDRGYTRKDGSVKISRVADDLMESIGRGTLSLLKSPLTPRRRDHWVARLCRRPKHHQSPIRTLILSRFLGCSARRLLKAAEGARPRSPRPNCKPHRNRISCARRLAALRPQKRQSWLSGQCCGRIRRNLYAWLWRNDRPWLARHARRNKSGGKTRIDWTARDAIVLAQIPAAIAKIRKMRPMRRASRHRIASACSFTSCLLSHPSQLPKSSRLLTHLAESTDAFACRRVRHFSRIARGSYQGASWKLRVASGINPTVASRPTVSELLTALTA